ncbi:MAG: branched-chain amino acid ABC transporter permease [Burkholderiaceae bacterium]|nr:branched-chain amino acid ABC transporter permease [Burkholderiaceae bacterium]
MSTGQSTAAAGADAIEVSRAARSARISGLLGLAALGVLAAMPYLAGENVRNVLVLFFIYLVMASMWNLLAGFGGLVSIGQQAYVGIGAYATMVFAQAGVQIFLAVILAAILCAVFAIPTALLAFRLRGDYFAVGTWVIAEVYRLLVVKIPGLGGPSGGPLAGEFLQIDPLLRGALTYWAALAVLVLTVFACYLLLRGQIGLSLTAVRDDEVTAGAAGVDVVWTKGIIYLISAAGCGAAGAVLVMSQLSVQPDAIFSVQWSALMIFIVIIGGIGYLEGPIVGAIIFVALQELLSDYGTWYLIVLGLIAMACATWLPRGLWGLVRDKTGFSLFPVGYYVRNRGS